MIGIILWAIVIIIIAFGNNPGLFLVVLLLGIGACILRAWLETACIRTKDDHHITSKEDRERAIDEWEKKWGRKHPTRINK